MMNAPFRLGFLEKCAEHGLSCEEASRLLGVYDGYTEKMMRQQIASADRYKTKIWDRKTE